MWSSFPVFLLCAATSLTHRTISTIAKVRMCDDGSKQIQGLDYDEPYAPAILSTTLRVQIALSVMFGLPMWHMDVSNAFQSTPAPIVEGKRIHSIPLPAGTEYEAALVTETPFDLPAIWLQVSLYLMWAYASRLMDSTRHHAQPYSIISIPDSLWLCPLQSASKRCSFCPRKATTMHHVSSLHFHSHSSP